MNRNDILIMNNIYDLTKKDLTTRSFVGLKDCTVIIRQRQILTEYMYNRIVEECKIRNIKLVIRRT